MIHPSLRATAVALVLLVTLAGCSTSGSTAATVGDGEISVEQLEADVVLFQFLTQLSGAPCGTPEEGEAAEAACTRFTLANEIREELAKAYAIAHDVSIDAVDVDEALTQLEEGLGGADVLRERMSEAGVTRVQIEAFAERLLLVNAVQQAVVEERLDDDTLMAAYDQDLGTFTTIEVAHILVADRTDAERIAAEVTPSTFGKTAQRESIDPGSADRGGSLGSFSLNGFQAQFDPDFVAATLALQPGDISGAIRTQFGWHVIHLVREDVAPFEDVRDQLQAREASTVFEDWFVEQVDVTDIDVNPRFGRFDPATGNVLPVRSTENDPTGPTGASEPLAPTGP